MSLVPERCIVILGNVVDGLTFVGPFVTPDDATQWAESHADDYEDWNVAHLHPATLPDEVAADVVVSDPTLLADALRNTAALNYHPTHVSRLDGSEAMVIEMIERHTYVLRNEDGDEWRDSTKGWREI